MTESSPQPGDNETQDATTEGKLNPEPAPDRATAATTPDPTGHVRASSSAGGDSDAASEPAGLERSGQEENGGADEEEDEDDEDDEDEDGDESGEEEEDDEDEDEEPKLKYARLTQHLGPVYRNGDATSAFLVAGDKMVRMPQTRPSSRRPPANPVDRSSALTTATSSVTSPVPVLCIPAGC